MNINFLQYKNECEMKLEACRRGIFLRTVYQGKCSAGKKEAFFSVESLMFYFMIKFYKTHF